MNFATAVLHVRDGLAGNEDFPQDTISRVMDNVQARLESGQLSTTGVVLPFPWFMLQTTQELTYPAEAESMPLPNGFVGFEKDWPVKRKIVSSTGQSSFEEIPFYTDLDVTRENVVEGLFTDSINIYLYRVPKEPVTIILPYYKRSDTKVSMDDSLGWLIEFPQLLIDGTVYDICRRHLRDTEGAKIAKEDFENSLRLYHVKVEERRMSLLDVTMNGRV